MGTFSIWHWVIVLAVVLILFGGRGKIPALMGDIATGIKSFKKGMKEEGQAEGEDGKVIDAESSTTARSDAQKDKATNG
jgi:sec-independent protein translocase protein TatA